MGARAHVWDKPEAMAQCECECVREREREGERRCDSPALTAEPERHSSLRAITTNDLCGQSRGPARVLISSPEKGTLLECYQGVWD